MFTSAQIKEIAALLKAASIKDAKFTIASALEGTEYVPILRDAKNRRIALIEVFEYLAKQTTPSDAAAIQCVLDVLHTELKEVARANYDFSAKEGNDTRHEIHEAEKEILLAMNSTIEVIKHVQDSLLKTLGRLPEIISNAVSDSVSSVIESKMDEYLETLEAATDLSELTNEEIYKIYTSVTDDDSSGDDSTTTVSSASGISEEESSEETEESIADESEASSDEEEETEG